MATPQNKGFGQQYFDTNFDQPLALQFIMNQMLNDVQTAALVKVVGVTHQGGVSPVGTVDVQPLVNQMTGDRKAVEHGVIYKIPYFRLQGGSHAVIIDPKVGDIGVCVFCSRDNSVVVSTKKTANPGSFRKFDWSDGLYFGAYLGAAPTQYVQFADNEIRIHATQKIILDAPDVEVTGNLTASGVIKSLSDVVANAISLLSHRHGGVRSGSDVSRAPQ